MARHGPGGVRGAITLEAARLMYEEGVKQYFTAKRLASKRVLGRIGAKGVRYRPQDLPSNGEIRDALLQIAELAEGEARTRRLFAMRVVALRAMRALAPFEPRLIGSVSTGHIRKGSDIDLHVFADDTDALLAHVASLGWRHDVERVSILKFGEVRDYTHVHVALEYEVELTVYERRELRFRPRSSTDGKPIVRIKAPALEALVATEHPEHWAQYLKDGVIVGPGAPDDDADDAVHDLSSWEGMLAEMADEAPMDPEDLPSAEELLGDEAPYDPLPGFEDA
jgi:hypothetical protein